MMFTSACSHALLYIYCAAHTQGSVLVSISCCWLVSGGSKLWCEGHRDQQAHTCMSMSDLSLNIKQNDFSLNRKTYNKSEVFHYSNKTHRYKMNRADNSVLFCFFILAITITNIAVSSSNICSLRRNGNEATL